jgi:hypothetical protein
VREQRVILEHGVHVTLVRRQPGGFLAMDTDRAGARLFEPGDQAQAGGLPEPEGPSMEKNSPSWMSMETRSTAFTSPNCGKRW